MRHHSCVEYIFDIQRVKFGTHNFPRPSPGSGCAPETFEGMTVNALEQHTQTVHLKRRPSIITFTLVWQDCRFGICAPRLSSILFLVILTTSQSSRK
jgi:hypothetical protein